MTKILLRLERLLLLFSESQGKQSWHSGDPRSSPSIKPIIMWDEFVLAPVFLCTLAGFPFFSKTNTSKMSS